MQSLLQQGRTVVAAVRQRERARQLFQEMGVTEGRQAFNPAGILFIADGVNVTDPETLSENLFAGVQQLVLCLGPVFGKLPDGTTGYLDGMTSERVDAMGTINVVEAAKKYLPKQTKVVKEVVSMRSQEDLEVWERLDDTIMGGNSSSSLTSIDDGNGVSWKGNLIVEGGGFCGARTKPVSYDLSDYDGILLRVKGDGRTLKLNVKTADFSEPEDTYQASFETKEGDEFTEIFLPWHHFVPVKRAKTLPNGPPLDPSAIRQFGIVYSRFSYNGFANDAYTPGEFEITFRDGIKAMRLPRPQLIMVSSAGVERNAIIGDDEAKRKADIPIVQLNPGGILNHKYSGEIAVRESGLSYMIVRPTGMSDGAGTDGPALLEASQGDRISGKIARSDVANVIGSAVNIPDSAFKTFEIRRSEAVDAQGKESSQSDMLQLFLRLVRDSRRPTIGLNPFPAPVPPPAPPSEERKTEILNDPRVKATVDRGDGGRVRNAQEEGIGSSATPASDGREVAAKQQDSQTRVHDKKTSSDDSEQVNVNKTSKKQASDANVPENVKEAREWIRNWRVRTLEKALPKGSMSQAKE